MSAEIFLNRFASTRIGVWVIKHIVSPLQRWIYQASDGKIFTRISPGRDVLLLTTRGRRTGKYRTTPVFYLRDGEAIIICNVNPGYEHTNPWVSNLRANPVARLQMGRYTGQYRAREATTDEVERFWPKFVALWPTYQVHFEHSGRRTIFILQKYQAP